MLVFLWTAIACGGPSHHATSVSALASVNPEASYVFYLHGKFVELRGKNAYSPKFKQPYRYDDIVSALSAEGFVVISEARPKDTEARVYVRKVLTDVNQLLQKGVPPERIAVIGHSKGGLITTGVAANLGNSEVRFVIMAGCGRTGTRFRRGYDNIQRSRSDQITGHILSIYDSADTEAGSCRELLASPQVSSQSEIALETGQGHGLFYAPRKAWLAPTLAFLRQPATPPLLCRKSAIIRPIRDRSSHRSGWGDVERSWPPLACREEAISRRAGPPCRGAPEALSGRLARPTTGG